MSEPVTPSARIVAAASATTDLTDSKGRVLTVRRLGVLDRARLFKAIGAEQCQNAMYLGYATLAASVTTLDGVPLPFPTTDRAIEAALAKLGDEGFEAVAAHFHAASAEAAAEAEAAGPLGA